MGSQRTVQLAGRAGAAGSSDLATALRSARDELGHRPAITVLSPDRREEQGVASLAQWAAKGAHLLEVDLGLSPGDRLQVAGPPSWTVAAVCLAAWWAGVTVTDGEQDADAAVVHEDVTAPTGTDPLWIGDAIDGSPVRSDRSPSYPVEVQAFPDDPPSPHADPDLPALVVADAVWSQRQLIQRAETWGATGTLGIDRDLDMGTWLPAIAVRPLLVGRPTVVLRGVGRARAAGEKVQRWL